MIDLGLTSDAFWALTPAQFQLLWRRHLAREERQDRRFSLLATLYANAHRDEKRRPMPYTIEDFLPRREANGSRNGDRMQSIEDQIEMCRLFTEAMTMPQRSPHGR